MLKDLTRLPARLAVGIVVVSAVVTAILFAAIDSVLSGDDGGAEQSVAARDERTIIQLGDRYPEGGADPQPRAAEPEARPEPKTPLRRLVGAKVIVRMQGTAPSPELLGQVRAGKVGGVILFPDNVGSPEQVRALTGALDDAAQKGDNAGVVIAVDQEGGPVKRLSGPPDRSPAELAASGNADAAMGEGAATGKYLSDLGINVDFAPVLDVPAPGSFIADRAFGSTPAKAGELGTAFAAGLQQNGVIATLKHFPGLGRATANTDLTPSSVDASRSQLRADMASFQTAIDAGASMVMMSNAVYPAFGPSPAVLNADVVTGELRQRLGFSGVVVTDDLEAGAITALTSPAEAAVTAAGAGVDMVLFAKSPASGAAAYDALLAAARDGRLERAGLEESYARIQDVQAGAGG